MQAEIKAVLLAGVLATVVASAIAWTASSTIGTWVRRIFLTVVNLSPGTMGTWRKTFSARETFLAAWFLTFVGTLIGLAFLTRRQVF